MWHIGSQFPDQGSNLHPLPWEHGVLTTGPPGKSHLWILMSSCTESGVLYSSWFPTLTFPSGASGKALACQYRRCKIWGFDPWVRKIPRRRTWHPVFLPEESSWTEEAGGLQSTGSKRVGHEWSDLAHTHPVQISPLLSSLKGAGLLSP